MVKLMRRVTSLVRLMDFRVPSNRFIAAAAILVSALCLGYFLYDGAGLVAAAGRAAQLGIGVFLAWAVARELDPDRPRSATFATLAAALLLFAGSPNLGAVLALLLVVRIVGRSTGRVPTIVDSLFIVGVAAYCARTSGGLAAGLALGAASIADARLPEPSPPRALAAGVVALAAALGAGLYFGSLTPDWSMPSMPEWVCLMLVVLAVISLRIKPPRSQNDRHQPFNPRRMVWATVLAIAGALAVAVFIGGASVQELWPFWAGVLGTALNGRIAPKGDQVAEI